MIIIIGGGVVGTWIANILSDYCNDEIFILEKEPSLWYHTSTRNSGVIHAGIYYSYHSLKRQFCISGKKITYQFLKENNIEHKISGKIIVGFSNKDRIKLINLKKNAEQNGVKNLKLIDKYEIKKLEPYCKATFALYSPETGVVNCSDYYRKMEALLQKKKVNLIPNCKVEKINIFNQNIETNRGKLEYKILINTAGLWADEIAYMCGIKNFKIIPYKGDYYSLNQDIVKSMIYPLPGGDGHLGVHLTHSAYNEIWIGPTSKKIDKKDDYNLIENKQLFLDACNYFLEEFDENKITEGFSGNRAKCFFHNKLLSDFLIFRQSNIIHLLGIDSPGLTSAPAIANYVKNLI